MGPKVGCGEASGNHQVRRNNVSHADGDFRYGAYLHLKGEGSEKEQWLLPALLSGRKSDNSVAPHMSLVPLEMLPKLSVSESSSKEIRA